MRTRNGRDNGLNIISRVLTDDPNVLLNDSSPRWWIVGKLDDLKKKTSRGNYTVDVKEKKKKRATGSFSWYCRAAGHRREDKTWNIYLLQPIEVKTVCGSVDVSRRDDNSRFYNNFSKHICPYYYIPLSVRTYTPGNGVRAFFYLRRPPCAVYCLRSELRLSPHAVTCI